MGLLRLFHMGNIHNHIDQNLRIVYRGKPDKRYQIIPVFPGMLLRGSGLSAHLVAFHLCSPSGCFIYRAEQCFADKGRSGL